MEDINAQRKVQVKWNVSSKTNQGRKGGKSANIIWHEKTYLYKGRLQYYIIICSI
uniref:Uncharacterized protein n=1 Tax=Arion vulgaris TaxID=1028688 RepID=A0A0B6ZI19_9EUPU